MPGTHQRKIFAAPIGAATPNAIYTQHAAKPARQQNINAKFSQLLLAQLPRTKFTRSNPKKTPAASARFTHSTPPKPQARKTSTQNKVSQLLLPQLPQTQFTHSTPPNPHARNTSTQNKASQLLMAQLPRTQFTHSTPPNPHAKKPSTQNFRNSYWHSYPKRNLHTARRQTRMPAHQHKIFAAPIGTANPNAIYTQHAAKPACQQDINAKFSHLLLAQLPRTQFTHSTPPNPRATNTSTQNFFQLLLAQLPQTQFTHSTPPNPRASKTSTQNFRSSHWHSYPKHNLHTARRQTRMPGTHQRKIFAAPIGTATPNAIYTQHAAKPACQQDINAKFSQLLLAQLPRTKFTHSKPQKQQRSARDLHTARRQSHRPGRHQRKIKSHSSYCHSYPKRNLHTARRQTRLPGTHQRKIKPHSSYWPSYPERNLHTARRQTRTPAEHQHKIFATPIGTATPNAIYTQHAAKPACQQDINTKFSQLLLAQLPQTQFTHSTPPNPHASKTSTQIFSTSS